MVLVLGPNVAHNDDRTVALDRPTRLLGGRLEHRLVLPQVEALGQRHVERFRPFRVSALGHATTVAR